MRHCFRLTYGGLAFALGMCFYPPVRVDAVPSLQQDAATPAFEPGRLVIRLTRAFAASNPFLPDATARWNGARPSAISGSAHRTEFWTTLSRSGATAITPAAVLAPQNAALADQLGLNRYFVVHLPATTNLAQMTHDLARFTDLIETAETDGIGSVHSGPTPNDPYFSQQYYLSNTGQTIGGMPGLRGADAHVQAAWEYSTGSPQVIVAVLDTGVSESHPDLIGKLVPGQNFTVSPPNANTDDSWFISHGTGCAGIIAASTNNGIGIAGVSWRSLIMPIKVANTFGASSESQCANGLLWAVDHGAKVASISLGFSTGSSFFASSVQYALSSNVVVCASAGNTPGAPVAYPARFPNVVSVGATDNRDDLATFTSTGPELFMCAPGVDILTTWDTTSNPNSYVYEIGTSFACPVVAGVASLIIAARPTLTNEQVRFVLLLTADDLGEPGRDNLYGWGRVNALNALLLASDRNTNDCGADWNHDGRVDSRDVFDFLAQYLSGFADFNQDGTTDSHDLFEFLGHFFVGC